MNREEVLAEMKDGPAFLAGRDLSGLDLSGLDLVFADFSGANLRGVNFWYANLSRANFNRADMYGADLRYANLEKARLFRATVIDANLSRVNLRNANLTNTNFRFSNLFGADLSEATMVGALFENACLEEVNLEGAVLPHFQIPEGDLVGWKKLDSGLCKLRIPYRARRTACLVSRKCRAEFAVVDWLEDGQVDRSWSPQELLRPKKDEGPLLYELGKEVWPDEYNDDIRFSCTHGIHFFLTRREAEEW